MASTITILLVYPDATVAGLLAAVLNDAGYRVQIAVDGPSALRAVATCPPALVVLDLRLPGMSGHAVLAHLRSADAPQLPIVVIGTNPDAQDLVTQGANAVLIKPVVFADLLACIAAHITAS
jgi:DNA-binding response OmpR family regulator